ncbi:uncharacterized protein LOC116417955 [Nasonia vitripennis]|uniref:Helitron helicase-like domain-containing protein n=1 Tax=Nasonia vitripennis TaxID=7425 RepID=A0A7M7QMM5_NASVI|nr:uncharacterized protein LOC116417955 [Nasonia vitripennis]
MLNFNVADVKQLAIMLWIDLEMLNNNLNLYDCCGHGSVVLDPAPAFPDELCISTMDLNVESWIYPLFYLYGTQGYKMAIRNHEFNQFLMGRRLFQQWIIDFYVKIEKDRIQYIRGHQKEIRADTYKGLHDYMENAAAYDDARIGKTIILPSTFIGSPRHMQQCYQDAMAIVNEKGKPCLFLTMTCNPKWKEVEEILLPHQQAADRPDLCARIFDLKKQRLFISAEIPNAADNPRLHEIVMKNMMHGPCGDWCMVDDKCSKRFPKNFQNETVMDENGYPYYRRRNNGTTHEQSNGRIVDNR